VLGVSPHHHHHHNSSGDPSDFGFSIVDGFDASALDPVTVDKFRAAFALDEKETLIAGETKF
jgi:alpha-L-fucosidase